MLTRTAATIAATASAMAVLASNAFKTRKFAGSSRLRTSVRLYRAETKLPSTPEVNGAVRALLDAGMSVRVFEGERIYAPTVTADTLVWELERRTSVDRSLVTSKYGRPYVTVEVA